MENERLQGDEQYHSKNYFLEVPCSHAKISLKSALQKPNFVIAIATPKRYALNCSCNTLARSSIVTHSSTTTFLIKSLHLIVFFVFFCEIYLTSV